MIGHPDMAQFKPDLPHQLEVWERQHPHRI
jgi:hypothetical protein